MLRICEPKGVACDDHCHSSDVSAWVYTHHGMSEGGLVCINGTAACDVEPSRNLSQARSYGATADKQVWEPRLAARRDAIAGATTRDFAGRLVT